MDLQALIDGLSLQWKEERAESQMTLGELIESLELMSGDAVVENIGGAHSYRGYYEDISFERLGGTRLASDLLSECKSAMGKVFTGYKGGDFVMGARTPVWIAEYGCCGEKMIGIDDDGVFETAEDD